MSDTGVEVNKWPVMTNCNKRHFSISTPVSALHHFENDDNSNTAFPYVSLKSNFSTNTPAEAESPSSLSPAHKIIKASSPIDAKHTFANVPTSPTTIDNSKLSPLGGIRVLDFTRIIAGPFATMLLGDLGAEILKIERPGVGDESRSFKPPEVNGESCYFLSFNRNKKSLAIDVKSDEGKRIILELVQQCDVLVENFMPGTMEKLGFGYDYLKLLAPHLIYCSISGYGPDGPWARRGGFDVIAAALGGFLNITGPINGEPVKSGIAVTDLMTAQYAHGAVLAALLLRTRTGKGQKIDCSLLATQIATLTNIGSSFLNTGVEPQKWGTDHETIVPYRGFKTSDQRWLIIGAANNRMWEQFCHLIELPHLIDMPEYKNNMDRVRNRVALTKLLEERFLTKTLAEWAAIFEKSTLPFGPVNNFKEAFSHPQLQHQGLVQQVEHPTAGPIKMTGSPVRYTDANNCIRSAPPLLGQHTCEILHNYLKMPFHVIAELRNKKAIDYPEIELCMSSIEQSAMNNNNINKINPQFLNGK